MNVVYHYQRGTGTIEYAFPGGQKIEVGVDGIFDGFDFSGMPDGEAREFESDVLGTDPIVYARKKDGELTVHLILWCPWDTNPLPPKREETV